MGKQSKISWTDSTFNPWIGCSRVSPGCVHCYAEELMANRYKRVEWGPQGTRMKTSEAYWKQPLQWNKEAKETGLPHLVFCGSLCDWLEIHPQISRIWQLQLFDLIENTPYLTWLLLTKRPENWQDVAPVKWYQEGAPDNVWFGISVEDQKRAGERLTYLKRIPAFTKFVSYEPAIETVDWTGYEFIDWLIVGGESGNEARPFELEWAFDAVRWSYDNSVKPFVKQLGSNALFQGERYLTSDRKGDIMTEWPIELQVQEFPR